MDFKCNSCGACCRHIGNAVRAARAMRIWLPASLLWQSLLEFPYSFDKNGTCQMYDPIKGCTVYEDRPDQCRVEKGYNLYFKDLMNICEYTLSVKSNCNELMDLYQLPDKRFEL